jgi:hypothetical protein
MLKPGEGIEGGRADKLTFASTSYFRLCVLQVCHDVWSLTLAEERDRRPCAKSQSELCRTGMVSSSSSPSSCLARDGGSEIEELISPLHSLCSGSRPLLSLQSWTILPFGMPLSQALPSRSLRSQATSLIRFSHVRTSSREALLFPTLLSTDVTDHFPIIVSSSTLSGHITGQVVMAHGGTHLSPMAKESR